MYKEGVIINSLIDKIGIQTFTIRNQLKTLPEMEYTISSYCEMGIKNFELARIKFSREELLLLKSLKEKYKINFSGSQITFTKINKNLDYLLYFSKELDIKYLEVSVIPMTKFFKGKDGILELCNDLNICGEKIKKSGVKLLYHHHNYELIKYDEKLSFDILLDNTSTDNVNFVCDTYWLARSGYSPFKFIENRITRVRGVHLRDNILEFKLGKFFNSDTYVGNGTIDFQEIKNIESYNFIDFYSIEQSSSNPYIDIEKSYNYLKKIL